MSFLLFLSRNWSLLNSKIIRQKYLKVFFITKSHSKYFCFPSSGWMNLFSLLLTKLDRYLFFFFFFLLHFVKTTVSAKVRNKTPVLCLPQREPGGQISLNFDLWFLCATGHFNCPNNFFLRKIQNKFHFSFSLRV